MQTWKVKLLCFAKPEFLDSGLGLLDDYNPLSRSSSRRKMAQDSYSDHFSDDDDLDEFDDDEVGGENEVSSKLSEGRCRIFRSITVVINEGRGIGELGSEIIRAAPVSAIERERRSNSERSNSPGRTGGNGAWSSAENLNSTNESTSLRKTASVSSIPNSRVQPRGASAGGSLRDRDRTESNGGGGSAGNNSVTGIDTFCEVIMDGEVVGRTSIKRGTTSPYWNETFELGLVRLSTSERNLNPDFFTSLPLSDVYHLFLNRLLYQY